MHHLDDTAPRHWPRRLLLLGLALLLLAAAARISPRAARSGAGEPPIGGAAAAPSAAFEFEPEPPSPAERDLAAPARRAGGSAAGSTIEGRVLCRGPEVPRAWIQQGAIDPRDRADAEENGALPQDSAALLEWSPPRPVRVDGDGAFGPEPVPPAIAYRVIATCGDAVATAVLAPGEAAAGSALDAGALAPAAATALEVDWSGLPGDPPFQLRLARDPSPAGTAHAEILAVLDPRLLEIVYGGAPVALAEPRRLRFAPLPADRALVLEVVAPTGERAAPLRVPLRAGATERIALHAGALFDGRDAVGATVQARLSWRGTGRPIGGARIAAPALGSTCRSDGAGRFGVPHVPAGRPLALEISAFDPDDAERVERVEIAEPPAAGIEVALELAPYRWIRATGLGAPPFGLGPAPLAFALESAAPGGSFARASAAVFRPQDSGVAISATDDDRLYRALALWTALLQQPSEPVALEPGATDAFARFLPLEPAPVYVECWVRDGSGRPLAFADVVACGPFGGLPPATFRSDAHGRAAVGPVNVTPLLLTARRPAGEAAAELDPFSRRSVVLAFD